MQITTEPSPDELNNFIVQHGQSNFLQSWEWGEFQKSLGRKAWRWALKQNNQICGVALLVKRPLPLNQAYLYCPRGPVYKNPKTVRHFLAKIRDILRQEKAVFFRFDFPQPEIPLSWKDQIKKAPDNIQPQHTLILDLAQSKDQILKQMKAKWRYNIRLACRKGVESRRGHKLQDFEHFWRLIKITTERNAFRSHPREYYRKMVEVLGDRGLLEIFYALYKGKVLAANIVIFFGQRATYVHGASDHRHRNVMAPHFLQWQQILRAQARGCREYDFWGIAPEDDPVLAQKWAGITRFKKGFGGKMVSYPGTHDLPLSRFQYQLYRKLHSLRS